MRLFNAEPYAGKQSVIGKIASDGVTVTAMHPDQRYRRLGRRARDVRTLQPVLRERRRRHLDMTDCHYGARTRIHRGDRAKFTPSEQIRVKLEGSGKVMNATWASSASATRYGGPHR